MADSNCMTQPNGFKEAVCINAGRIYDSCSEVHRLSYIAF